MNQTAVFGVGFESVIIACAEQGWFDNFMDKTYDNGQPAPDGSKPMDLQYINIFSLIFWCVRCVVSRMIPGDLQSYHAIDPKETSNYFYIRAHLHHYMTTPIVITYCRMLFRLIAKRKRVEKRPIPFPPKKMHL